jgi:tRNA/tmRNA/rRNA uracil-C5-methylase (TrmA/RlmC/RlmD family)
MTIQTATMFLLAFSSRNIVKGFRAATLGPTVSRCRLFASLESTPTRSAVPPDRFNPYPFEYRQEIEVKIESLNNQGYGIARVDVDDPPTARVFEGKKWVVMAPNVIPGETVRLRVFRNYKNFSEADVVQVLDPSPSRIVPKCPLASECGGCQYQHITIDEQRSIKTDHVKDAFRQFGLDQVEVQSTLGTEHIFEYRSKLTPHYQAPKLDKITNITAIQAIGFQRQTSRSILDVPDCIIATPQVNVKYKEIRETLLQEVVDPTIKRKKLKGATLHFRQGNLGDTYIETEQRNALTTTVRGIDYTYLTGNFFQNNYYVLPLMVDHVVEQCSKPTSAGTKLTHLVDCYCGSGLFALSAASSFDRVIGIEISDRAVAEATANAEANNLQCEFLSASAEAIFEPIQEFPRDETAVILDPPRKGCSNVFLELLIEFSPRRIVYMSCDPTTQARDAAVILESGQYRITSIQPFDLFPQTRHIECLAIFEKI